jgi:mannose-1-phosphate guanylyltransferase
MQRRPNEMHRWGVILAGGDGTRLKSLTRLVSGDDRPKQFCPLLGRRTLLAQTRRRIAACILPSRTVFALMRLHEPFYSKELENVPPTQMVVQSSNRGTLPAILWSLLRVIQLDRHASVAFFPSDHSYSNEEKFMYGVESAFDLSEVNTHSVILLGATSKEPEVEYGWIEPEEAAVAGRFGGQLMRVKRFWEKPSYQVAEGLRAQGCLWNTFVMVGRANAFVEMIQRAVPNMYRAFQPILALPNSEMEAVMMKPVYEKLAIADFSREILSVSTEMLAVARLGDVGWSDLGDPRRLITTLLKRGIENPWVTSGSCNRSDLVVGTS